MTRACSAAGCERPAAAKGLCLAHYKRKLRGSTSKLKLGERRARLEPERVINTRLPRELEAKLVQAAPKGQLYAYLRRLIRSGLSCNRCRARAKGVG